PTRACAPRSRLPPGHLRGFAQPGAGAHPAVADRPDAQYRVRLGEQPLPPSCTETADRPSAFTAVPRGDRAPARAGSARRARPYQQHPRQPSGNRTGRAAPGARDHASGGLGVARSGAGTFYLKVLVTTPSSTTCASITFWLPRLRTRITSPSRPLVSASPVAEAEMPSWLAMMVTCWPRRISSGAVSRFGAISWPARTRRWAPWPMTSSRLL